MSRLWCSIYLILVLVLTGCVSQATPTPVVSTVAMAPTFTLPLATVTATLAPSATATQPALPTQTVAISTATVENSVTPGVVERKPDWSLVVAGNAIMSPITAVNGLVYFGSEDNYLYAVDSAARAVRWKFKAGGTIRSQPAVSMAMVFIASDDGYVYGVSNSTGIQVWKQQIAKAPTPRDPLGAGVPFTSSPTLQGSILYVGSWEADLDALDAQTGKVLWTFATGKGFPIYITPQISDGLVLFGDYAGNFFGVDARKGTQSWVFQTDEGTYNNGIAIANHVVYLLTSNGLHALDAKTGKSLWVNTDSAGGGFETPIYEDGVLYIDANRPDTYYPVGAYDATNGAFLRLVFPMANLSAIYLASPTLGKTLLYIGLYSDAFYAVDRKSGSIMWKIPVMSATSGSIPVGVVSTAAIMDGMVYFAGMDGVLYAVKAE